MLFTLLIFCMFLRVFLFIIYVKSWSFYVSEYQHFEENYKTVTIRYRHWEGWCLPARWCTDYLDVSVQCVQDRGCPPNSQCGRPILIARCQHRLQFTFIWLETCICLVGSVAWWLDYQTKSQEFYSVGRLCFSNDFMRHRTSIVSW